MNSSEHGITKSLEWSNLKVSCGWCLGEAGGGGVSADTRGGTTTGSQPPQMEYWQNTKCERDGGNPVACLITTRIVTCGREISIHFVLFFVVWFGNFIGVSTISYWIDGAGPGSLLVVFNNATLHILACTDNVSFNSKCYKMRLFYGHIKDIGSQKVKGKKNMWYKLVVMRGPGCRRHLAYHPNYLRRLRRCGPEGTVRRHDLFPPVTISTKILCLMFFKYQLISLFLC